MWITNSGFADLFTVFAKIDGEKFSAFLIERGAPGLSIGAEEHKLGIRGSSTCPLILNDCRIPVENLLGEAGKGHHIAFNILNIGRLKLGAAAVGGARNSLGDAIGYARERKAFGKSISEFGLIQEKIAECAAGVYAGEALVYRTIGMIDAALADIDPHAGGASREIQKKIEEYAVECSILKVWGSEMLDMVVDHTVQIFAGYGYVEEYPAERAYRDSRINRIFEGTNEINRLIITGFTDEAGHDGAVAAARGDQETDGRSHVRPGGRRGARGTAGGRAADARRREETLSVRRRGRFPTLHDELADQQEIVGALADCIMEVYAMESAILRTEKLMAARGEAAARQAIALTQYYAAKAHAGGGVFRPQGDRRGGRGRHAPHPDGHRPPPVEIRAGRHGGARPPDRAARGGGGPICALRMDMPGADTALHPGLSGRVAIVTGASRGIGKALALRLAAEGAAVVVAAKSVHARDKLPGTVHETAEAIARAGGRAIAVPTDVREEEAVRNMVERAVAEFGRIDILVNNAGAIWLQPILQTPPKRFDLMMGVNVPRGLSDGLLRAAPHGEAGLGPHPEHVPAALTRPRARPRGL